MFSKQSESPDSGLRFCPRCRLNVPVAREDRLCPECGETLIPQGYCRVCEDHWTLAVGAPCPKHDVLLEAVPPAPNEPISPGHSISWITVTVFANSLAAAIPRTRLEAEGIPTFLDGERMGGPGMYGAATVGVKLQVPTDCAADARIILSQNWALPSDEKADFDDLL
jgi:hypothetical protein